MANDMINGMDEMTNIDMANGIPKDMRNDMTVTY